MPLAYQHVFLPAKSGNAATKAPPLLLLHGTGGNERDLLPLARELSPASAVLSPRGDVSEHGQLRFFRRFAEGVFDLDDVAKRTHALADFIAAAAREYDFDTRRLSAIGFSNGANIAATLLQLRPESMHAAVLLRPMVVLDQPAPANSLAGKRILIASGTHDPIVPNDHPPRIAAHLRAGGATVTLHTHAALHGLAPSDVSAAKSFLDAS
jgi:phospholipase/carboxylesterase